jgi:hypothetical protein
MLLAYLKQIPDQRTPQGRMFDLPHVLLFSILAIASGADSYRKIAIFIEGHFNTLCDAYHIQWKRPPCYNSIRHIIHGLNQKETEKVFRMYAEKIATFETEKLTTVSLDGKALKHSFDNIADEQFKQILSAFSPKHNIVLAHAHVGVSKENEINAAITLMKELNIDNVIYTLDALHTQKNVKNHSGIEKNQEYRSRLASQKKPTKTV